MSRIISEATRRNWNRLNPDESLRLTKRANKKRSAKKIVPVEYFSNKDNQFVVSDILSLTDDSEFSITDILCSAAENLFNCKGILGSSSVQKVLSQYSYTKIESIINSKLPQDERDLLGIIYQSYLPEGKKNLRGSYYTQHDVTSFMVSHLPFSNNETFLDPCCGSGAFLLSLSCDDPECLYGIDNDPIAAMIAKFNLLLRFPDKDFVPNIFCADFLTDNPLADRSFDYIATNPPWGAFTGKSDTAEISSQETFSLFFVKSYKQLKNNGIIRFLLPEAVLNVKMHRDIRRFILDNCSLNAITVYDSSFSGVVTGFVDIECQKSPQNNSVRIKNGDSSFCVDIAVFSENKNNVFRFLDPTDQEIIDRCRKTGRHTLENSTWALGIVTGDNTTKLKSEPSSGLEPIYTGKEIVPYRLKKPNNYILYNRSTLQQAAKEEYYRAPEKLVYKFISKKLVFALDDQQKLFLNSANILIPNVPDMSIKTVLAFLNSELFTYLHQKMFGELKILKGNLVQLPFPEISPALDRKISSLTERVMAGSSDAEHQLQNEIYSLFNLSDGQIEHIRHVLKNA